MQLLTDRASIARLASSRRLAVLVGSYDGNPNFGDVMQLVGALDALSPLRPLVTPMIVIAAEVYQEHVRIAAAYPEVFSDAVVICFAGEGELFDAAVLEEMPHLAAADPTCLYFYGGGYANNLWGQRKAILATAVVDWLTRIGKSTENLPVFITGVQIEPSLLSEDHPLLGWFRTARFCRLRDPESAQILKPELPITVSGIDDALPMLIDGVTAAQPEAKDDVFTIGIHLNLESYANDGSEWVSSVLASTLSELKAGALGKLRLRHILAYEGGWVRESATSAVFSELAAKIEAEIGEPINISIGENVDALGMLDGAIACSYHTTMATCLQAVPTLMIVRNPYYSQKFDGLRVWFDEDLLQRVGPDSDPQKLAHFLASEVRPTADLTRLSALCRTDIRLSTSAIGAVLIAALEAEIAAMARISLETSSEASRLRGLIGTHLLSSQTDVNQTSLRLPDLENSELAHDQIAVLRTELSRAYRRPLRPLSYLLKYRIMFLASRLVRPISARLSKRFAASASKRDPRRFELQS